MAYVFVVDDDPRVRLVLRRLLERDGHEVRTFPDGGQALRSVALRAPDVVVSDIYMPGGDGIELIIRLTPTGIPLIAISGGGFRPSDLVLAQAARLGAVATLEKPFTPGRIRQAVRWALDSREERHLVGASGEYR